MFHKHHRLVYLVTLNRVLQITGLLRKRDPGSVNSAATFGQGRNPAIPVWGTKPHQPCHHSFQNLLQHPMLPAGTHPLASSTSGFPFPSQNQGEREHSSEMGFMRLARRVSHVCAGAGTERRDLPRVVAQSHKPAKASSPRTSHP